MMRYKGLTQGLHGRRDEKQMLVPKKHLKLTPMRHTCWIALLYNFSLMIY